MQQVTSKKRWESGVYVEIMAKGLDKGSIAWGQVIDWDGL